MSACMEGEGRAPRPARGDPNEKMVHLRLTVEEWRQLRVWAARQDTGVQQVVAQIVRSALKDMPKSSF